MTGGQPPHGELSRRLWRLHAGDHICCLYETDEEHRWLVSTFLRHGLERYDKTLYIVDGHTADELLACLREESVQVDRFLQSGQLSVLTSDDSYVQNGVFEPERMIALLQSEMRRAADEGYRALRVCGEMSWALRGLPGCERLIEYEARLNTFFPGSRCLALCQYDRRRFDPRVLLDVLATHPMAVIGTEVYENFYYMTPQEFLGANPAAMQLNTWLTNLKERKRSENQIRTLTQKLLRAQEDDRRMISRELHDRVGQDLSSIKISLETLFDRHSDIDPDIRQQISRLSGVLDRTIYTVRDLAYDLRPPGLDDMGIVRALSMYCEDFSEKSGIRVEYLAAGIEKMKLDFTTQINLYRMIQEGLINIQKHAAATRASVKLAAAYPFLLLRIEDDGRGFDVEKREREMDSEKRMGLRSLRERTLLLGGTMIVASQPGQGTRILIKLPYTGGFHGEQENHRHRG
jgi:signal transduction histidine kinase